jgi:hypothetical protein
MKYRIIELKVNIKINFYKMDPFLILRYVT